MVKWSFRESEDVFVALLTRSHAERAARWRWARDLAQPSMRRERAQLIAAAVQGLNVLYEDEKHRALPQALWKNPPALPAAQDAALRLLEDLFEDETQRFYPYFPDSVRPDLIERTLNFLQCHGNQNAIAALEEFRKRYHSSAK